LCHQNVFFIDIRGTDSFGLGAFVEVQGIMQQDIFSFSCFAKVIFKTLWGVE